MDIIMHFALFMSQKTASWNEYTPGMARSGDWGEITICELHCSHAMASHSSSIFTYMSYRCTTRSWEQLLMEMWQHWDTLWERLILFSLLHCEIKYVLLSAVLGYTSFAVDCCHAMYVYSYTLQLLMYLKLRNCGVSRKLQWHIAWWDSADPKVPWPHECSIQTGLRI